MDLIGSNTPKTLQAQKNLLAYKIRWAYNAEMEAKAGLVGAHSRFGQAVQGAASIAIPGDLSDVRSPIRSTVWETITPGGGRDRNVNLRRFGRRRREERGFRCPVGFQYGGRFTDAQYSTCGLQLFDIPEILGPSIGFRASGGLVGIIRRQGRVIEGNRAPRESIADIRRGVNIPDSPSTGTDLTKINRLLNVPKNGDVNIKARDAKIDEIVNVIKPKTGSAMMVRRDGQALSVIAPTRQLREFNDNPDMQGATLIRSLNNPQLDADDVGLIAGTGIREVIFKIPNGSFGIRHKRDLTIGERRSFGRMINSSIADADPYDPTSGLRAFADKSNGAIEYEERIADQKRNTLITVMVSGRKVQMRRWVYETFYKARTKQDLVEIATKTLGDKDTAQIVAESVVTLPLAYGNRNLLNYKAAAVISDSSVSSMMLEIKRTRALWDPSLAIPGGRRGGWRCPPNTRYGGQITDEFGRNCGWGLTRRLANTITDVGERMEDAAEERRKRRLDRRNRRMERRLQGAGRIERVAGAIGDFLERPRRRRRGSRFDNATTEPMDDAANAVTEPMDDAANAVTEPMDDAANAVTEPMDDLPQPPRPPRRPDPRPGPDPDLPQPPRPRDPDRPPRPRDPDRPPRPRDPDRPPRPRDPDRPPRPPVRPEDEETEPFTPPGPRPRPRPSDETEPFTPPGRRPRPPGPRPSPGGAEAPEPSSRPGRTPRIPAVFPEIPLPESTERWTKADQVPPYDHPAADREEPEGFLAALIEALVEALSNFVEGRGQDSRKKDDIKEKWADLRKKAAEARTEEELLAIRDEIANVKINRPFVPGIGVSDQPLPDRLSKAEIALRNKMVADLDRRIAEVRNGPGGGRGPIDPRRPTVDTPVPGAIDPRRPTVDGPEPELPGDVVNTPRPRPGGNGPIDPRRPTVDEPVPGAIDPMRPTVPSDGKPPAADPGLVPARRRKPFKNDKGAPRGYANEKNANKKARELFEADGKQRGIVKWDNKYHVVSEDVYNEIAQGPARVDVEPLGRVPEQAPQPQVNPPSSETTPGRIRQTLSRILGKPGNKQAQIQAGGRKDAKLSKHFDENGMPIIVEVPVGNQNINTQAQANDWVAGGYDMAEVPDEFLVGAILDNADRYYDTDFDTGQLEEVRGTRPSPRFTLISGDPRRQNQVNAAGHLRFQDTQTGALIGVKYADGRGYFHEENIGEILEGQIAHNFGFVQGGMRLGRAGIQPNAFAGNQEARPFVYELAQNGFGDVDLQQPARMDKFSTQEVVRAMMANFLMQQSDRHGNNMAYFIDDNGERRLVLFDHGAPFAREGGRVNPMVLDFNDWYASGVDRANYHRILRDRIRDDREGVERELRAAQDLLRAMDVDGLVGGVEQLAQNGVIPAGRINRGDGNQVDLDGVSRRAEFLLGIGIDDLARPPM